MAINILPGDADQIADEFMRGLSEVNDEDETVFLDKKPSKASEEEPGKKNKQKTNEAESDEENLEFQIYESDEEESGQDAVQLQKLEAANKISRDELANNDTQINEATSTDEDSQGANKENVAINKKMEEIVIGDDDDTKDVNKSSVGRNKSDVGSRTMEQWLNRDNLIVHPVWIGNLPRGTTVNQLRHFVECQVGRVLVSIHISIKQQNNERTYAFLNLPTAEKQLLAVTLLDGKIFTEEKLIVRPKRPSKFPQSFFGSSPISEHFKHFRDCVVPAILANPTINLNVTSVRKILEQNTINIDHLPNRVWCVQCTLVPQCHRTYCSFYHCHQEKELGRIISILAAQNCGDSSMTEDDPFNIEHKKNLAAANNPNTVRSRHTLLIQGLPRSITSKKIEETFEVFGEIDNVIVNPDHTCYVRMKRSQDARKIVHLFKYNHAGVVVDFAPYGASSRLHQTKNNNDQTAHNNNKQQQPAKPVFKSFPTAPIHPNHHHPHHQSSYQQNNRLSLVNAQSHNLPITNPNYNNMSQRQQPGNAYNHYYPTPNPNLNQSTTPSANTNTNNNNMYIQHHQQQQQQMSINNRSSARSSLKLGRSKSEGYNPYQHQTHGHTLTHTHTPNPNPNQNRINYQTPNPNPTPNQQRYFVDQPYQQYYQQQGNPNMAYWNTQYSNNGNAQYIPQQTAPSMTYSAQYPSQVQPQPQAQAPPPQVQVQSNNGYGAAPTYNHNFSGYAYSQSNALSPIAQTPINNVMNTAHTPTQYAPSYTPTAQSYNNQYGVQTQPQPQPQTQPQQTSTARKALGLRNAYSEIVTSHNQSKPSSASYDDSMTQQQYLYHQQQQQQQQQQTSYDDIINNHQIKNMQHKTWMTNQQQVPVKRKLVASTSSHSLNKKNRIPEPDLHFQMNSHDLPLSPTSILKNN